MHFCFSQRNDFLHIGWYAGMSLIQGGPGFPLLADAVYHYLCTGEITGMTATVEDLPLMIKQLVQQVYKLQFYELFDNSTG